MALRGLVPPASAESRLQEELAGGVVSIDLSCRQSAACVAICVVVIDMELSAIAFIMCEVWTSVCAGKRSASFHPPAPPQHHVNLCAVMQAADQDIRIPNQNELSHRQGSPQGTQEEGQEAGGNLLQFQQAAEESLQVASIHHSDG